MFFYVLHLQINVFNIYGIRYVQHRLFGYPFCVLPATERFPWDDIRKSL